MGASNALEDLLLDHIFTDPAFSPPDPVFVALCDTAPLEGDTGSSISEVGYTNYARVSTTGTDWGASSSGAKSNSATISFPACGATGDTATHFAILSATSAGILYAFGMLATSQVDCFCLGSSNTVYAPGHGFSNDDRCVFLAENMPGGLGADTNYYVIGVSGDTFQVSLSSGGGAVAITSDGFARVGETAHLAISNGITPQFAASGLTLRMR